jgi:hypothetical protein
MRRTASGKRGESVCDAIAIGRPRFNFTSLTARCVALASVRFGAHYGIRSDIALSPKSARTITALGNVVGRAVAIRMQIEDLCRNTKMSRRP